MIRRLVSIVVLSGFLLVPAVALADRDRDQDQTADRPEEDRGAAFQRVTGRPRETVKGGTLLVIAYGVVWATVFGYVALQWRRQARVRDDLNRMERALEEERKAG
jgi:CcmD family protein